MSAWWLLPLALAACLAVLAIAACLSPKPRHAAPRRHLAAVPEPVAPAVGSMSLLDELAWQKEQRIHEKVMRDLADGPPGDGTFAFTVGLPRTGRAFGAGPMWEYRAEPDWREQTAADLSPEALEDSGPGGLSSLTPGPDPAPTREVDQGWAVRVCAPESRPAARADMTGSLTSHHEERPGPVSAPPDPGTRLADTADVMDARLLAEVEAMLRAQDDDTALYLSRLRSACAQARLDLQAALA